MKPILKKNIVRSIFKQKFVSYQIRSEILDVYFGIRPSVRFVLDYKSQAVPLAKFLIKLKLKISVSKGYVLHNDKEKYQDWFINKKGSKKMLCFYVSKSNVLAEHSRKMDESKNDEKFGKSLGYPNCCINFVKKNKRPPTIIESLGLYSKKQKYNPYTWPCLIVLDSNLISHFPCNKKCKESILLAKKRLNIIKKYSNQKVLKYFKNNLSKFYILKNNKIITKNKYAKGLIGPEFKL